MSTSKTNFVKRKRSRDDDGKDVAKDAKRFKTKASKKDKKEEPDVEMKTSQKGHVKKDKKESKVEIKPRKTKYKKKGKVHKVKKEKKVKAPEIKTKVFDGPKFNVLDPDERAKSREFLLEHGFVVVYNVADAKQVKSIKDKAFDFMHQANPHFDPNDTTTWTNANTPGMFGNGIMFEDGVGQSPAMWEARTLPTMRTWFSEYFNTQRLLTSFDGMAFFRGAEHKFLPNRAWLHTDQDMLSVPDLGYSVQGALNLVDCKNPYDSGSFLVVDKSHLEMERRLKAGLETDQMNSLKRHFYKLAFIHDMYKQVANEATPALLVPALAGECVYWLSTAVHANYAPITSNWKNMERRLVTFVALAPIDHFPTPMGRLGRAITAVSKEASKSSTESDETKEKSDAKLDKRMVELEQFRKLRHEAANQGMTTSHWPTITPAQSLRAYPRCSAFAKMTTPMDCFKIDFTPSEKALLLGTAPYEADD